IEDEANEDYSDGNDADCTDVVSTDAIHDTVNSVPGNPLSENPNQVEIAPANDFIILPDGDDDDIAMYDRPNRRATVLLQPNIPTSFAGQSPLLSWRGHGSNVNAL
ncbi:hypothetical protein KC19_N008400, partial [Ceratodon purpureus]